VRSAAEQHHRATGLTGTELASAVTADQLRAALLAHNRSQSPQTPTGYADASARENVLTPDDGIRALLLIAAHFDTPFTKQEAAPSWT
jgi:hypothetical protein